MKTKNFTIEVMNGRVSVIDGGTSYTCLLRSRFPYTGLLSIFLCSLCLRHFKETEEQLLCAECRPQFSL